MHIILGATGHVGSVVAQQLIEQGEPVTVVIHNETKAGPWEEKGARVVVADVHDAATLHEAFNGGERLFLMLPPGEVSGDALQEEYKILDNYHAALVGSKVKKIVGLSSMGADIPEHTGNLLASHRMEHLFNDLPLNKSFVRPAYYFSNWDLSLDTAREEGVLHTFYPPDLKFPMVAPHDIGVFSAQIMLEPINLEKIYTIVGPEQYCSLDVAAAFSKALGKKVEAVEIKPDAWEKTLIGMGFSMASASEFIEMTQSLIDGNTNVEESMNIHRGKISLQEYVDALVCRPQKN